MAKNANAKDSARDEEVNAEMTFEKPPELGDYQDVTAERADGWFQPQPGAWLLGRLLGRFEMNDGERAFYQVKVQSASAQMMTGKGDDARSVKVEKGNVVAVDERKALEILRPYAESDGIYSVLIQSVSKDEIKGGKSFWRFVTKCKALKPPTSPLRAHKAEIGDVPF
jgi:hypothetical protein